MSRSVRRRKIPVAAIQLQAHDRAGFDDAWPAIAHDVDAAARSGAGLLVLPEATVPGYVLGCEPFDDAQAERAGRELAAIAARRRVTIVYGAAKRVAGSVVNVAIALGPDGSELGFAAKQFLWHFDRKWFAAGRTLQPIDTPAGRLGLLVCADGRIPSIAATLVDRGAELLVMPTAWVTSGRDPAHLENVQADLMVPVRARENDVAFVAANKCGVELASVAYCGKSAIVDAAGTILARGPERTPAVVTAEVDVGASLCVRSSATVETASASASGPTRIRVAFAAAPAHDRERLQALARQADADMFLTREDLVCANEGRMASLEPLAVAAVTPGMLRDPRALIAARLDGIDCFACVFDRSDSWNAAFARTRAAELRAYVIAYDGTERAFAVDPDGAIVAGTFDDYRLASFTYDRTRSATTQVAPSTDVLAGLRVANDVQAAG